MSLSANEQDTHRKMDQTLDVLKKELTAVRTGRASADILAPVMVEYYGAETPLNQLATLGVQDAQTILVTPFDKSAAKEIEKAIRNSDLGLNPTADGDVIRVPVPIMTEERRKDLGKHVRKLGEDAKVAIRNVRRDANEHIKKLEKDKEVSQDDAKRAQDKIQTDTDRHVQTIDDLVKAKEADLLKV